MDLHQIAKTTEDAYSHQTDVTAKTIKFTLDTTDTTNVIEFTRGKQNNKTKRISSHLSYPYLYKLAESHDITT